MVTKNYTDEQIYLKFRTQMDLDQFRRRVDQAHIAQKERFDQFLSDGPLFEVYKGMERSRERYHRIEGIVGAKIQLLGSKATLADMKALRDEDSVQMHLAVAAMRELAARDKVKQETVKAVGVSLLEALEMRVTVEAEKRATPVAMKAALKKVLSAGSEAPDDEDDEEEDGEDGETDA